MEAEIQYLDGRYGYVTATAYTPGQIVIRPDLTLAWFDGLEACAIGAFIQPQPLFPTVIILVESASATTFAAGAVVYWDNTAKKATATSAGNTRMGIAARAKTAGQLNVLVNCIQATNA